VKVLEGKDKLGYVETGSFLSKAGLLLQMPEKLSATLEIGYEIQVRVRLKTELEPHQERRFQRALQNFALANGVRDLLLRNDLLFGQNFHGIYALRIPLPDLEDTAKCSTTNELEKLKVARGQGALRLEGRSMGRTEMNGRSIRNRAESYDARPTLNCSKVTCMRISPVTGSFSGEQSLNKMDRRGQSHSQPHH